MMAEQQPDIDKVTTQGAPAKLRSIHSYVLREGRLTSAQERAFERFWPVFGIDWQGDGQLDLDQYFAEPKPIILEIGFGNGESLLQMALAQPDKNWLGLEMHRPGMGHLLIQAGDNKPDNLRLMRVDAVSLLRTGIAPNSLAGIQLFFPDPWPKKRHHKRRILSADNLSLMSKVLNNGGYLHAATDWQDYADQMLTVLEAEPTLHNLASSGHWMSRPATRPLTKFEQRGLRLGHQVRDLIFIKKPSTTC